MYRNGHVIDSSKEIVSCVCNKCKPTWKSWISFKKSKVIKMISNYHHWAIWNFHIVIDFSALLPRRRINEKILENNEQILLSDVLTIHSFRLFRLQCRLFAVLCDSIRRKMEKQEPSSVSMKRTWAMDHPMIFPQGRHAIDKRYLKLIWKIKLCPNLKMFFTRPPWCQ